MVCSNFAPVYEYHRRQNNCPYPAKVIREILRPYKASTVVTAVATNVHVYRRAVAHPRRRLIRLILIAATAIVVLVVVAVICGVTVGSWKHYQLG